MARPCKDGRKPAPCKSPEGRPTKWTEKAIEKEGKEFLAWIKLPNSIWFKDFALERDYDPGLFSIWSKSNDKFSQVLEQVLSWQESKLFKLGLFKKTNVNCDMAKFALARKCGWKEEQIVEHTGVTEVHIIDYSKAKKE